MQRTSGLGAFLRSRRGQLQPQDVGVNPVGARRQVPGLRRKELAQLAGVSVAYYIRLEQGQSHHASDGVLDALARALRLDDIETAHLHNLAKPARARRHEPHPELLRPQLRAMIDSFDTVPAYIVGRRTDALTWNRLAHALLADHLGYNAPHDSAESRPNLTRLLFLDPHQRELYPDWNRRARDAVAALRRSAGHFPDDRDLLSLIGELTTLSEEFADLWAAHPVGECGSTAERYHHPLAGSLTLGEEVMRLPTDAGQRLVVLNAEPNSPSTAALQLLAATHRRGCPQQSSQNCGCGALGCLATVAR
ncbi:helix-turn-helix transcriptional regulator [Streptomyces sp. P1-3]|uniref:helix-turn-helix transcriptional regulator n=1 Tax=Streptomyces sp. P1-3 TaxID=3421658 RepID=UPI003D35A859